MPRSAPSTPRPRCDGCNAAEPRPVPVDRPAVYARVAAALDDAARRHASRCLPTGLPHAGDEAAFAALLGSNAGQRLSGPCPTGST